MKFLRAPNGKKLDFRELFTVTTRKPSSWEEVKHAHLSGLTSDQLEALKLLPVVEVPPNFGVSDTLEGWKSDYGVELVLTVSPFGSRTFYYVNTEGYDYCRYVLRLDGCFHVSPFLDVIQALKTEKEAQEQEKQEKKDPRDEFFVTTSIPIGNDSSLCIEFSYTVLGLPVLKLVDTITGTTISRSGIFAKHLLEAAKAVASAQEDASLRLSHVREIEARLAVLEGAKQDALNSLAEPERTLLSARSALRE